MDEMMSEKGRDETGKYSQQYSSESFLKAVRELGPAVGTQDVAEAVGCDRDTAYRRLRTLEEDGEIESRKVGMARLWTITD
jgi:GTP-sensing pleiotropic transcriptional regulator CodY